MSRSLRFCKLLDWFNWSSSFIREGLAGCRLSLFLIESCSFGERGACSVRPVSSPHSFSSESWLPKSSRNTLPSLDEPMVVEHRLLFCFKMTLICPSLLLTPDISLAIVWFLVSSNCAASKSSRAYSNFACCSRALPLMRRACIWMLFIGSIEGWEE